MRAEQESGGVLVADLLMMEKKGVKHFVYFPLAEQPKEKKFLWKSWACLAGRNAREKLKAWQCFGTEVGFLFIAKGIVQVEIDLLLG